MAINIYLVKYNFYLNLHNYVWTTDPSMLTQNPLKLGSLNLVCSDGQKSRRKTQCNIKNKVFYAQTVKEQSSSCNDYWL